MDIATSSRPYFSMPSPTAEEKISLQASNTVYTYHCLCSHLLLATTTPLPSLPTRQNSRDKAHMMPLPPPPSPTARKDSQQNTDHYGLLLSTRQERTAEIVTSDEGFEKRYLQRCGRCNLAVGYQLDWQQFAADRAGRREDIVFLLPGGFITTSEMIMGKTSVKSSGGIGSTLTVTQVKA